MSAGVRKAMRGGGVLLSAIVGLLGGVGLFVVFVYRTAPATLAMHLSESLPTSVPALITPSEKPPLVSPPLPSPALPKVSTSSEGVTSAPWGGEVPTVADRLSPGSELALSPTRRRRRRVRRAANTASSLPEVTQPRDAPSVSPHAADLNTASDMPLPALSSPISPYFSPSPAASPVPPPQASSSTSVASAASVSSAASAMPATGVSGAASVVSASTVAAMPTLSQSKSLPSAFSETSVTPLPASETVYLSMSDAMRGRVAGYAPSYPRLARNLGRETVVVVKVRINVRGGVEDPAFLQGDPLFRTEVLNALKTWRFKPPLRGGKPVAALTMLKFSFKLRQ